jgi:type IV pilus assembly protein PilN
MLYSWSATGWVRSEMHSEADGAPAGTAELRREIIEQLQKSRPEIVHLFDEMARQMPEGVYLNGLKQTGSRVDVRGIAQSSTRVSALMRQIDASAWMKDPEVERVETTTAGASRQAEFVVNLRQESAKDDPEDM